MRARVRAELLRLTTQGPVWIFVAGLAVAAAYTARWSPYVVEVSQQGVPPELRVSLGGAIRTASTHIGTGLGVMLAAVCAAAGPGRDFVDGSAETRRLAGSVLGRFAARVVAISLLLFAVGVALAVLLVAAGVAIEARNGYSLELLVGDFDAAQVAAGAGVAVVHVTWVVALAQRLRTQAGQLALPGAAVIAMLMVSRLSPGPVSPDSWFGPLLGLEARRAMLDFWWSVGGRILWPWGNVALLVATLAVAVAVGVRSDDPRRLAARA